MTATPRSLGAVPAGEDEGDVWMYCVWISKALACAARACVVGKPQLPHSYPHNSCLASAIFIPKQYSLFPPFFIRHLTPTPPPRAFTYSLDVDQSDDQAADNGKNSSSSIGGGNSALQPPAHRSIYFQAPLHPRHAPSHAVQEMPVEDLTIFPRLSRARKCTAINDMHHSPPASAPTILFKFSAARTHPPQLHTCLTPCPSSWGSASLQNHSPPCSTPCSCRRSQCNARARRDTTRWNVTSEMQRWGGVDAHMPRAVPRETEAEEGKADAGGGGAGG